MSWLDWLWASLTVATVWGIFRLEEEWERTRSAREAKYNDRRQNNDA